MGPFSTTTRVRKANTPASNPHAGLVSGTRVSTVVYRIRLDYVLVDGTRTREEQASGLRHRDLQPCRQRLGFPPRNGTSTQ